MVQGKSALIFATLLYVYVYLCIYIYIYMYICVYIYIYLYIYLHVWSPWCFSCCGLAGVQRQRTCGGNAMLPTDVPAPPRFVAHPPREHRPRTWRRSPEPRGALRPRGFGPHAGAGHGRSALDGGTHAAATKWPRHMRSNTGAPCMTLRPSTGKPSAAGRRLQAN